MFLLVSVCHVGAHPGEHQHGVSIQISISLGKTFLQIPRIRNIPPTFHFPDSGLYLLDSFDFYFDLFWMACHWKPAKTYFKVHFSLHAFKTDAAVRKNKSRTCLVKGSVCGLVEML